METLINAIRPGQILKKGTAEFPGGGRETEFPCSVSADDTQTGISSCWRKNTSAIESAELANLLRALRKVAGHLGKNTGRIAYTGMSAACENTILIEPEMVMGCYPVPADRVDRVLGLMVHEALHRMEWSDHVWKILEPAMDEMTPREKVIFQKIVRTGESIFVDLKADQGVFGLYTRIARNQSVCRQAGMPHPENPSVDALMLFWFIRAFETIFDREIRPEYIPPLRELEQVTIALKSAAKNIPGVIRRSENRAARYLDAWDKIKRRITGWKVIDKQLSWFTSAMPGKGKLPTAAIPTAKNSKKMNPILIREIETQLAADAVDMTPIIYQVAGYDNESVVPISRWDFNQVSNPVIDRKMVSRLKAIFSNYADRRFLVSRGLLSGKLDHRKLHRAPVSGRCFKAVDRIADPDWNVALLIDASGSMRGNKWQLVENAIATVHKALTGFRNSLSAWAYFEVNGICMISSLIQKNRLFSVPPSGQTASGQAIIAAACMMPSTIRRNILLHVTDGDSNFGCDVAYGIEYCRLRKIHLITLGCGYKHKNVMQRQYGRTIQFIDYFEQLPAAMESLFKRMFWYGGRKDCQGPLIALDSA